MSRAQRLLDLIQQLRGHRRPVSGATLAATLGVSLRTLYRDIETLKAQGADIDGEAGVGFVLRPGFMLPPLMFTEDEVEAVLLGSAWVAKQGDGDLATAARTALLKIAAVLPKDLADLADTSGLIVGRGDRSTTDGTHLSVIRAAIRRERKLRIRYRDGKGRATERVIWPFALGFFESARVVAAWCETRADFRHFRTDRIADAELLEQRYPRRQAVLIKAWRAIEGLGER